MARSRTPLMAGNWKMNNNHIEAAGLVQKLAWTLQDKSYDPEQAEVAVIPPFTDIRTVQTLIEGEKYPLKWGAQDVSAHLSGAYTGEVSADMLARLGCSYVIVGHSERREYHGESDEVINIKAQRAYAAGITPIICVGEPLEVREAGQHVAYGLNQLQACLADLPAEQVGSLVIAYEPVWAIGTGRVASAADAQEVCGYLRMFVGETFSPKAAKRVRILYGGSVKSSNVVELMQQPDIDGALVGGACLDPEDFAKIATFYTAA